MRFRKLSISWDHNGVNVGAIQRQYGPLIYHDAVISGKMQEWLSVLKPDKVSYTVVSGTNVGPHRDHHIRSAINYYIVAAAAMTLFWKPLPGKEGKRIEGALEVDKDTKNVFDAEDLEYQEHFIAKDGEVYLLDVQQVHSVYTPMRNKERTFLQFAWYRDFDTSLRILEKLALT